MKNLKYFLYLLSICNLFQMACDKPVMKVLTGEVTDVYSTSARISGKILSDGEGAKYYGHCYSTNPDASIADAKTSSVVTIGIGNYSSFLEGLEPGTEYYARAYMRNDNNVVYGNEVTFTTGADLIPEVTTYKASNVSPNNAISGGNIKSSGGIPVIERGVCWNISTNPVITDSRTTDGSGSGSFISNISDLIAGTTYYVRAYATRSTGTIYGNEISFTTPEN